MYAHTLRLNAQPCFSRRAASASTISANTGYTHGSIGCCFAWSRQAIFLLIFHAEYALAMGSCTLSENQTLAHSCCLSTSCCYQHV